MASDSRFCFFCFVRKIHKNSGKQVGVKSDSRARPGLVLRELRKQGLAFVVLQGKDRLEDNTDALHAALVASRNAGGLIVDFRGEGVLGPFPVLELCDRLQELRSAGKRLVTLGHSWLGAPDLLLWLQGNERFLTASGYGHVRVPKWSKYSPHVLEKPPEEHLEASWAEFLEAEGITQVRPRVDDPRNYAYEQVLERLNEFFPVHEYVNKVVPRKDLVDFGLITGEGLDRELLEDYTQAAQKPGSDASTKRQSRPS